MNSDTLEMVITFACILGLSGWVYWIATWTELRRLRQKLAAYEWLETHLVIPWLEYRQQKEAAEDPQGRHSRIVQ